MIDNRKEKELIRVSPEIYKVLDEMRTTPIGKVSFNDLVTKMIEKYKA